MSENRSDAGPEIQSDIHRLSTLHGCVRSMCVIRDGCNASRAIIHDDGRCEKKIKVKKIRSIPYHVSDVFYLSKIYNLSLHQLLLFSIL